MRSPFSLIVYLVAGYICGLFFAPNVFSSHIPSTEWQNIWVYVWLFGWPFMLIYLFIWPLVLVALQR